MDFRYKRIEAYLLALPCFIPPLKVGEKRRNNKARLHHLFHDIPSCAEDLRFRFGIVSLHLRTKRTAGALYIVHRIVSWQTHQRFRAVWAWHEPYNLSFTNIPCQTISCHFGIRSRSERCANQDGRQRTLRAWPTISALRTHHRVTS